ncbi:uncharacterized protein LOC110245153 [Exaiptasia diaphana]|uniref:Uncharacterized protein n=1 Tax=Exaiptasia diaphana TaxID=2652724 RepID=A0A913XNZ9_EXADI|nr:uncharacterized protein LOC110245153 [Exaiptasia diaphana]KXJ10605.1 hypothetical protein AC249_AIPGENE26272 [Exaiptasia diaphana]
MRGSGLDSQLYLIFLQNVISLVVQFSSKKKDAFGEQQTTNTMLRSSALLFLMVATANVLLLNAAHLNDGIDCGTSFWCLHKRGVAGATKGDLAAVRPPTHAPASPGPLPYDFGEKDLQKSLSTKG